MTHSRSRAYPLRVRPAPIKGSTLGCKLCPVVGLRTNWTSPIQWSAVLGRCWFCSLCTTRCTGFSFPVASSGSCPSASREAMLWAPGPSASVTVRGWLSSSFSTTPSAWCEAALSSPLSRRRTGPAGGSEALASSLSQVCSGCLACRSGERSRMGSSCCLCLPLPLPLSGRFLSQDGNRDPCLLIVASVFHCLIVPDLSFPSAMPNARSTARPKISLSKARPETPSRYSPCEAHTLSYEAENPVSLLQTAA